MLYTKAIIEEKWGAYCDTNKLIDDMMTLLTKYKHRNSEHGVCKLVDKYFTNKEPLIKLLSKSANYKGDMRIILKVPFARECQSADIYNFVALFVKNKDVRNCILSYRDKDNKALTDYIRTGMCHMSLKDMRKAQNIFKNEKLKQFSLFTGALKETEDKVVQFEKWMSAFMYYAKPQLESDWGLDDTTITLKKGMKTSRAFNRICTGYGVDKCKSYNKEFAKYADMVSSAVRNLDVIISVNPLDYLTMSFGKSWASCHTIDKNNVRRMPDSYSGMYCNGTLSYMLDESSIVTYVLDDTKEDELHNIGKLYRNMFHVNIETGKFIQGRIYPQGNDGSIDLYSKFRGIIQEEFTKLLGLSENRWRFKEVSGSDTLSSGAHFQDYHNYGDCKVFYPVEKGNEGVVNIGSWTTCAYCGEELRHRDRLSHGSCDITEQ